MSISYACEKFHRTAKYDGLFDHAAYSPDGSHVVACDGADSNSYLYSAATGELITRIKCSDVGGVYQCGWSSPTSVVFADETSGVSVIDVGPSSTPLGSRTLCAIPDIKENRTNQVATYPRENMIVSVQADTTVRVWDTRTATCIYHRPKDPAAAHVRVAFATPPAQSPHIGPQLALLSKFDHGDANAALFFLDLRWGIGSVLQTVNLGRPADAAHVAYCPPTPARRDPVVACVFRDNTLALSLCGPSLGVALVPPPAAADAGVAFGASRAATFAPAFTADGVYLVAGTPSGDIAFIDVNLPDGVANCRVSVPHSDPVRVVATSPVAAQCVGAGHYLSFFNAH